MLPLRRLNLYFIQGLRKYTNSIEAYTKALECVSKENPTPNEIQQKKTYEEELWAAEGALRASTTEKSTLMRDSLGKHPWDCAAKMVGELRASGNLNSSVSPSILLSREPDY